MSDAQPHNCLSQTVCTKIRLSFQLQGQKRNSTQLRNICTIDSHKQEAFQYHSHTSAKNRIPRGEWRGWRPRENGCSSWLILTRSGVISGETTKQHLMLLLCRTLPKSNILRGFGLRLESYSVPLELFERQFESH